MVLLLKKSISFFYMNIEIFKKDLKTVKKIFLFQLLIIKAVNYYD